MAKNADGKFPVRVFFRLDTSAVCNPYRPHNYLSQKIILPPAYNFAQYDGAPKLFVVSPHSEDFNNFFFGVYLINKAVLNIYTSGICAG